MKKDNLKLIVFIEIGIVLCLINTVNAEICECNSCNDCTEKMNDDSCSEVKLINDITIKNNSDYYVDISYGLIYYKCIYVSNTSNKIFDCQGNKIEDLVGKGSYGIIILNVSDSIIKNCIISEFSDGIVIGGANNKILNNSISFSSVSGLSLGISGNNEVIRNEIYRNSDGLYITGSSKNTIINNKIHSNINGITLYYHANFNSIVNNKIYNNSETGIYMTDIIDPRVCRRAPAGECSKPNTGNEITKNEITKNRMGILSLNSNFTLNSNIICGNEVININNGETSVGEGDNNTCDDPGGWNDNGKEGCTYKCNEQKPPDKPPEPDYNLILSIAIILITILLSVFIIWYKKFKKP